MTEERREGGVTEERREGCQRRGERDDRGKENQAGQETKRKIRPAIRRSEQWKVVPLYTRRRLEEEAGYYSALLTGHRQQHHKQLIYM